MLVYILFKLFTGVNSVFSFKQKKKRHLEEALLFPGNGFNRQKALN